MPAITVGHTKDLADGKIIPVEAAGRNLVLTRIDGTIYALARKCTHMGADLCAGTIVGAAIVCPKHKAAFEVATGKPVDPAKILFLKMIPKPLATYPVTIAGDEILVSVE